MGSTSSIFAALINDWSLSAWRLLAAVRTMAPGGPYSDIDTVIGEDESGVGGCELRGRHCDVGRLSLSVDCRLRVSQQVKSAMDGVQAKNRLC
jgi:hypothetical protein